MKKSRNFKPQHKHEPQKTKVIIGQISINSKAVGFVPCEGMGKDIEIQPENLNMALHGDEVEVSITGKFRGRSQGKVVKILQRAKDRFAGEIIEGKNGLIFSPDDRRIYTDFSLPKADSKNIQKGLKVLVQIVKWNNPKEMPECKIVEIIGKKGDNDTEMKSIVLEKGFDLEFPPSVIKEAEEIKHSDILENVGISGEPARRKDFRKTLTFTIDPEDAKDFDDAISFKELPDGLYEIGVHIADASHYVREGTSLDREARKRGFSVYLVDRVIPMLPEALSNDICSLNPKEDKLSFSAVFTMDKKGKIKSKWFGKTIICSDKRFTYETAQASLDNPNGEFHKELTILNIIAKILREEKFRKGAIDFDQDEVKFTLDENGKPIDIIKKTRLDTHKLVEEYMLLANKEVAEFVYKAEKDGGRPFLYRIHDFPDQDKIADLAIFLKALGYELPIGKKKISPQDINVLLKKIEGKAEESLIKTATIRSMAKAIYSTQNIGHFGLAFQYYTHFTSPIRRYPDLLVHRVLAQYLENKKVSPHELELYGKIAGSSTDREIAAAEAERNSKKYKQVEYMSDKVGKEFEGIISGVTEWGIYVEEIRTKCEGMIRLADLGEDYYVLNQKTYSVVGEKTKNKFTLGDKIKFKVASTDLERRTMNFELVN